MSATAAPAKADVTIIDHGSIVTFYVNNPQVWDWVNENVELPEYLCTSHTFKCEHRFADNLIRGLQNAGFNIR